MPIAIVRVDYSSTVRAPQSTAARIRMTKTAFYAWILLQAGLALGRELNLGVQDLRLDLSERDKDPPSARERKGPRRTIMQCLGTETLTRACHFENVYYELSTERFVHFGIAGARQEVFGDDTPIASMPDDPWLRLIKCARRIYTCISIVSRDYCPFVCFTFAAACFCSSDCPGTPGPWRSKRCAQRSAAAVAFACVDLCT